jgi:6-phosphogluconolactonase
MASGLPSPGLQRAFGATTLQQGDPMKYTRLMLLTAMVAACSTDQDAGRRFPLSPDLDQTTNVVGQVFTMSNAPAGNSVLVFDRAADGSLTSAGSYPTGGLGTGGGLGNQGGVTLDESRQTLLVVSAGSNELSAFRVRGDGSLERTDKVASGGVLPISVTISGRLVYVLNSGGSGNITGFELSSQGKLIPLPGSTRPLSTAASDPAQVAFAPGGKALVVTEKATNVLSTYLLNTDGTASGPIITTSSGTTPFGFGFTNQGALIVSEAFGGAVDGSAVSSYTAAGAGNWSVVSGSAPTTETAACWIVVTPSGRFAYTTNAGSGTITGYAIHQGDLEILDASGVTGNIGAGTGPTEMAISRDGRVLYALAGAAQNVAAFAIGADGSLNSLPNWISGLPAGTNGLAAR